VFYEHVATGNLRAVRGGGRKGRRAAGLLTVGGEGGGTAAAWGRKEGAEGRGRKEGAVRLLSGRPIAAPAPLFEADAEAFALAAFVFK
jgi:hypothetical protein